METFKAHAAEDVLKIALKELRWKNVRNVHVVGNFMSSVPGLCKLNCIELAANDIVYRSQVQVVLQVSNHVTFIGEVWIRILHLFQRRAMWQGYQVFRITKIMAWFSCI